MDIHVEHSDALGRRTDLLVLKYAQNLYGVDAAAAHRIGGAPVRPAPGRHCTIARPANIGARTLVFLGTTSLSTFSYPDIRDFGRRAVEIAAAERLGAEEICLTLHGVGFGLDETEAFDDRFHYGIAPPLHNAGLVCERLDKVSFTGDVVQAMERRIRDAEVVVADISLANPNVYLEIGYAWAAKRPTILLCAVDSEPRFNVRGHRYLRFSSIRDLERQLTAEIVGLR